MSKISNQAADAFTKGVNYKNDNTEVVHTSMETVMFLYGNKIATMNPAGEISVSLAGWNTKTTRSRLNELPGVSIGSRKGVAYLNGNPIDDDKFYKI